jgi:hypothetical protein
MSAEYLQISLPRIFGHPDSAFSISSKGRDAWRCGKIKTMKFEGRYWWWFNCPIQNTSTSTLTNSEKG